MKNATGLVAAIAVLGFSGVANAHTLHLECKKLTAQNAVCRAYFTDGEIAAGMPVVLYDEDDKVLAAGKTDVKGEYAFKVPGPEYNVVISASKAEVASISSEDIW